MICVTALVSLFSSIVCLVAQSCPTLRPQAPGSSVHGDSPGKNTGVGCRSLLQGIFPTQGLNPCLHIACRFFTSRATTETRSRINHIKSLKGYASQAASLVLFRVAFSELPFKYVLGFYGRSLEKEKAFEICLISVVMLNVYLFFF